MTKEREELTTACEQWHRKVEEADKAVSRLETELRMLEEALSREALTVSQCVEKGETLIVFTLGRKLGRPIGKTYYRLEERNQSVCGTADEERATFAQG